MLSWGPEADVSSRRAGGFKGANSSFLVRGDFQELPFTKDIVEAGLAGDTNLYYMALVERGTGNLFCS